MLSIAIKSSLTHHLSTFPRPLYRFSSIVDMIEAGKPMQIITEGTAVMHYDPKETVFYNKVQVLNRDLSIQVIKLYSETLRDEKKALLEKRKSKDKDTNGPATTADIADQIEGITVLDALAASGLRSIRYLKEIPDVKHLTINDLLPAATDLANDNCQRNNVDMSKVIINNQDATILMYNHRNADEQYDVIDLDPYGSAVPFLDGAVQAVKDGGLLCVTCTDMTALAGSYPEVCFSKYQSIPVKARFNHEMALRILLHCIDSTANRYKRHIVPWLSLSIDFYVRVFVRIYESPAEVKRSCLKRSMVYQCTQTPTFYIHPLAVRRTKQPYDQQKHKKKHGIRRTSSEQAKNEPDTNTELGASKEEEVEEGAVEKRVENSAPVQPEGGAFGANIVRNAHTCPETDSNMKMGGPFWSDPIHNQDIINELHGRVVGYLSKYEDSPRPDSIPPIPTAKRLGGVLSSIKDELKDVPLHYSLPDLASTLHVKVPTIAEFQGALHSLGYRFSQFHHDPNAVKTDAPVDILWDIMRAYTKLHPPVVSSKKGLSAAAQRILSKEVTMEVDFSNKKREKGSLARYPPNPEANWGPKRRAGRGGKDEEAEEVEMVADGNGDMGEESNMKEPEPKRSKL